MLEVKEAVNVAIKYLKELYDDCPEVLLEEVELSDDQRQWFITLSFLAQSDDTHAFAIPNTHQERKYKLFRVDGETGEVKSMKIRTVTADV